jgi:predicted RNA binding protein YcfA (HicA-like mRNA interferase family)
VRRGHVRCSRYVAGLDPEKLLERLRKGSVQNVSFAECRTLVEALGFELDRVRGSHHIFRHRTTAARLNIQKFGGKAKPYQLRQLLSLIEQYDLTLEG